MNSPAQTGPAIAQAHEFAVSGLRNALRLILTRTCMFVKTLGLSAGLATAIAWGGIEAGVP